MAKFCTRCGRPLNEGEVCSCSRGTASPVTQVVNVEAAASIWESMKNRMGIGGPDLNKGDAYEKGKKIVPECVNSNESEIPVKQYEVATLRTRLLFIPIAKAIGRVQVTNKRVIFRAPGRNIGGRTTLQHEFSIDEIAGLEARREYVFNIWDFLIGIIVALIGGGVMTYLLSKMFITTSDPSITAFTIFTFIVGIAGCIPFFMLKKKWLVKLLCQGASFIPLMFCSLIHSSIHAWDGKTGFAHFIMFLGIISVIFALVALFFQTIRPSLVMIVKNKAGHDVVDIQRIKMALFGRPQEDHTGYAEVIPASDAEKCIREINAMINDIQKLGDFGIEKWKN